MQIETIPQMELGDTHRVRVGDVLNRSITADSCQEFRFAVAYMRRSGLDRLGASIDSLLNRGGHISGAVGIDDGITSLDALEALRDLSPDSTIFYTVSGFRFHPKVYVMSGSREAVVVAGSANLSLNGLFRNVEFATALHLDLTSELDRGTYDQYNTFVRELLNMANPNVQPITDDTLRVLSRIVKRESQTPEPGPGLRQSRSRNASGGFGQLFPPMQVPVAPPAFRRAPQVPAQAKFEPTQAIEIASSLANTFIMQLSAFDSSHRTGVPGTSEILVPHAAMSFFPPLAKSGRKYPDTVFDVSLNTPNGRERHSYRLWYYEERAVGSRIDENRLRMDHATVDLSAPGGGDLLVVSKLPEGSEPLYEVTVVSQMGPMFRELLGLCCYDAQGKKWGLADS